MLILLSFSFNSCSCIWFVLRVLILSKFTFIILCFFLIKLCYSIFLSFGRMMLLFLHFVILLQQLLILIVINMVIEKEICCR